MAELEIEHFFNIQLVGEQVIEINPRISTIVYQEDLNLPYLGVKHALGEIGADELARASRPRPPRPHGAPLLRPGRVGRMSAHGPADAAARRPAAPVVHCPVNTAGVPWTNVQALRRRGIDATLVVFQRYRMHPEADWSLERHGGQVRRQLTQWHALGAPPAARRRLPLLLRPHARAAVAPVPDPAAVREAVGDALPRLGHPRQGARRDRLREEGRRRDRRQLRRDPLGAGGARDPARHRPGRDPAGAAVQPAHGRSCSTRRPHGSARAPTT